MCMLSPLPAQWDFHVSRSSVSFNPRYCSTLLLDHQHLVWSTAWNWIKILGLCYRCNTNFRMVWKLKSRARHVSVHFSVWDAPWRKTDLSSDIADEPLIALVELFKLWAASIAKRATNLTAAILQGLLKEFAYRLILKLKCSNHCSLAGIIAATKEPKISQVRAEAISALNAIALIYKVNTLYKLFMLILFLNLSALQLWVVIPCKSLLFCSTRKRC